MHQKLNGVPQELVDEMQLTSTQLLISRRRIDRPALESRLHDEWWQPKSKESTGSSGAQQTRSNPAVVVAVLGLLEENASSVERISRVGMNPVAVVTNPAAAATTRHLRQWSWRRRRIHVQGVHALRPGWMGVSPIDQLPEMLHAVGDMTSHDCCRLLAPRLLDSQWPPSTRRHKVYGAPWFSVPAGNASLA
jgi:hypothetical protein